jgi:urease accessory protein
VVVHPPGGIAGGDHLALDVVVGAQAHAVITTPGAAKWYRTAGPLAVQEIELHIASGGVMEWLPQETIVFDGARARQHVRVELSGDALFAGWEITCFGRAAAGERFERGHLDQSTEILHEGRMMLAERGQIEGGAALFGSQAGLAGHTVSAMMMMAGSEVARVRLEVLREVRPPAGCLAGVTALPGVLVARFLGPGAEAARTYFAALWALLRPALIGRAAVPPRIWRC